MIIRIRRRGRGAVATAAAVAAAAVLAACSGDGKPPALSQAGLHDKVRSAAGDSKRCPLDYDLDKAASAAHVPGAAKPVSAHVDLPEDADKDAVLSTAHATDVECDYTLGSGTVSVETLAAEKGSAAALLAPLVQRDAELSSDQLKAYVEKVQKAPTGTPVVTPTGSVALVRLRGAGTDSVVLMVSCGTGQDEGGTKLTAAQVRGLAQNLGGQAHW
ncbi:hypothetical protein [Streptomyces sp. NPDC021020]|uniref:hypothetical protein n=1 Tax=Streptomyces sp. NPDC021020 TaxID=3365109 RepID=UPI0037912A05